ncbi:MAG: cobaltochelatase subunit CobS, partial [Pseudomonadota bacterium]|nr:cobaltochelatase subunit CobS [Pseudomonadota bacterium]
TLNYLSMEEEVDMVLANVPSRQTEQGRELVSSMVTLAGLTRTAFAAGEIATVMSPRTVITWLQNLEIFDDMILSFQYAFLNKSDPEDRPVIAELFQRCLGEDLPESLASTVTSDP